jgi:hypothetical protein
MNDKPKGMIDEARQTGTFLVSLIHAGAIPLRLVSRIPGSMGAAYLFPGVLWGYATFGALGAILLPNYQPRYLFHYFQATGWWWLVHLYRYFASHRKGIGTYSHSTGVGWLNLIFPRASDPNVIAFLSDAICAISLAVFFLHRQDKYMAALMGISVFFSFSSSSLLSFRDQARKRHLHTAMEQQRHWQSVMQSLAQDDME